MTRPKTDVLTLVRRELSTSNVEAAKSLAREGTRRESVALRGE
jgi:hypothetical protein